MQRGGILLLFALPLMVQAQNCRQEINSTTPSQDFVDEGNGIIIHKKTGLMWLKCPVGLKGPNCTQGKAMRLDWKNTLEEARHYDFAGHTDWRLPNMRELRTIVERQCSNPTINLDIFPNTPAKAFWSSSLSKYYSDYAWGINFRSGRSFSAIRSSKRYIRLVR